MSSFGFLISTQPTHRFFKFQYTYTKTLRKIKTFRMIFKTYLASHKLLCHDDDTIRRKNIMIMSSHDLFCYASTLPKKVSDLRCENTHRDKKPGRRSENDQKKLSMNQILLDNDHSKKPLKMFKMSLRMPIVCRKDDEMMMCAKSVIHHHYRS